MIGSSTPRRMPLSLRRLHTPYMYKQVFETGRTLRGSPLTVRFLRADSDWSRIGYIIRKKSGNAPFRNSVRRTLRRSFQDALPTLAEGLWIIFDVSDKASAVSRSALKGEADRLLLAAGAAAAASPAIAVRIPPSQGVALRAHPLSTGKSTGKPEGKSGKKAGDKAGENPGRRFRASDASEAARRQSSSDTNPGPGATP